ncbi:MAG: DMT family transporter [Bdellovibrionota bacterium]|nr:DMT family transporter [Deltaproteobacteria bacterium]
MNAFPYLGELMAMTNAILWSIAFILFKVSGHNIKPFTLNFFKNVLGSISLLATLAIFGQIYIPGVPLLDYVLLIGSGVLGIAIADTLLFKSLNILGASRSAVVDSLYAPFIMLFSFIFLRESITWMKIIGVGLIVFSIPLIYADKKKDPIATRDFIEGLAWGALAMATMGIGIVYIKPQLETYPLLWTTTIRMIGGTFAMFIYSLLIHNKKQVYAIFTPQKIWKVALPSSFIGAYPCILLWVGSFKYAQASIAGLITQLSMFFTVILAGFFLKEPMTAKKWLAVILAFTGSAIATFTQ